MVAWKKEPQEQWKRQVKRPFPVGESFPMCTVLPRPGAICSRKSFYSAFPFIAKIVSRSTRPSCNGHHMCQDIEEIQVQRFFPSDFQLYEERPHICYLLLLNKNHLLYSWWPLNFVHTGAPRWSMHPLYSHPATDDQWPEPPKKKKTFTLVVTVNAVLLVQSPQFHWGSVKR